MFDGMSVGVTDSFGNTIYCGDEIQFHEYREGFKHTTTEDGWGRDVPLHPSEQVAVPAQHKDYFGVIFYCQRRCMFRVKWDKQHDIGSWGSNEHPPRHGDDDLAPLLYKLRSEQGCWLKVTKST